MKRKVIKDRLVKRVFDIIVSLSAIVLLSPIIFIIIISLKIEGLINRENRGPIFYKETRISRGKPFQIYKFRTVKARYLKVLKESRRSITEFTSQKNKSAYLTPTGTFLATIYFDELPQLFNVLIGNLSLVGPRPHIPDHYKNDIESGIVSAKYIKAGIMGLVQGSKGNPKMRRVLARMATKHSTINKTMILIDRLYFQKYLRASAIEMLLYDIGIILRCIRVVLEAKGI